MYCVLCVKKHSWNGNTGSKARRRHPRIPKADAQRPHNGCFARAGSNAPLEFGDLRGTQRPAELTFGNLPQAAALEGER
jgi:hypothetical protein